MYSADVNVPDYILLEHRLQLISTTLIDVKLFLFLLSVNTVPAFVFLSFHAVSIFVTH